MKRKGYKKSSFSIAGVICFFVLIALVMQIAILSYDYISSRTDNIFLIAILVFIVIVMLSAFCVTFDVIRRKIMIDRPVQKILSATEKIASGDFSVRIDVSHSYSDYNAYDYIAENLNIMAGELGKSEMLNSDFISSVSHEIKTPLAIIQSYAGALAKDDLDPDMRKKYAETLVSASNRLSGLVSNILKLNKLENQSIKPEFELINLTAQLSESIIAFEDIIEKKKLELDCDLDDVKIVSSSAHLELVWNNLISNAIKFTDEGGKISVSLKRLGNSVIVKISDSGCGISPEVGGRIFDKFYQGDTSRSSEGNGLGLALVKKVIDVIGGEISVTSQLGQGSMFTITLKENENA